MRAWLAARLPHVQSGVVWSGRGRVFRIYAFKPFYRCCVVNFTKAEFYEGKPAWVVLRVFGWTLYERNAQFSGLPKSYLNG